MKNKTCYGAKLNVIIQQRRPFAPDAPLDPTVNAGTLNSVNVSDQTTILFEKLFLFLNPHPRGAYVTTLSGFLA